MRTKSRKFWQNSVIFYLGGMLYCAVELLWRGYTHGSMFILGGLCFLLVGSLDRHFRLSILSQMLLGTLIITALELVTGLLVNRLWHMGVWDYSALPLNFMGQICLPYSLLWFPLTGAAIFLENGLRHLLFHEKMPQIQWVI